jgi:hypothetical protein
MEKSLLITGVQSPVPMQIAAAGGHAAKRFIEFFTANIVSVAAETLVIVGLSVRPGLLPLDA